ncbi:DGAT1/2-independent enzyme synthesizing storage lipids-like [Branchiostoma lanceolatum]|uniref:DGAT1/2-independent enzyme synthesizing storage lipids-like n=1 Tax=Branchiostoma lanceolatum TaxID=7740 RepID=UPI003451C9DA
MSFRQATEYSLVCNATTEQLFTNTTVLSWTESVTVAIEELRIVMATVHAVREVVGVTGVDLETIFFYYVPRIIAVLFIVPWYIMGSLFVNAIIIRFYSEMYNLTDPFDGNAIWQKARCAVSAFWAVQAKLLHGYEIHGYEKLPKDGPGLIVYYHGTLPVDMYYMMSRINLDQGRPLCAMTDRFMFSIPGLSFMMDAMGVHRGEPDHCVKLLKEGKLLALAPGGVREALFGHKHYRLIWKHRMGFANVAKRADVPIFPMFTQNLREVFRTPRFGIPFLEWVYEKTRMPVVLIYGGFPVKLRTYIGDPIYDPSLSAAELAKKTHDAIEELIERHQRIPGSTFHALLERFQGFMPFGKA